MCALLLGVGAAEARRLPQAGTDPASVAGSFDYYLLALSWSPTYCLANRADVRQCENKGFGLVLHGLWPQYREGGYPRDCATDHRMTLEARKFGNTIFPSPKLVDHEWTKHGVCSGLGALDYFKAADEARTRIKVPAELESPAQTRVLSAAQLMAAFASANPGMPKNSIVFTCRGPALAEVRVCLDRKLSPQACGHGVKTTCRSDDIRIPAAR